MARVALVTGGSRGIGAAISLALQAVGCKVAANYAGNDEAAAKFKGETGIAGLQMGRVATPRRARPGIAKVEAELGPVEILVNNAGITRDAAVPPDEPGAMAAGDGDQCRQPVHHDAARLGGHARRASSAA